MDRLFQKYKRKIEEGTGGIIKGEEVDFYKMAAFYEVIQKEEKMRIRDEMNRFERVHGR
ncbi:hypothetical protein SAMN05192534_12354 [Alteribacillus persepolensis]|uniref:Uncharacterized protein n=1 Tax=Alteribacillus persepolensis TaxID=568899 RepID=A0A1G8I9H8_9BACI|nr:hypothetical protein [Alteribacillus persepolensis]SDI15618.1 hypothetical protein SAMN05192534_12354 [Alteribacillus persepolensis]